MWLLCFCGWNELAQNQLETSAGDCHPSSIEVWAALDAGVMKVTSVPVLALLAPLVHRRKKTGFPGTEVIGGIFCRKSWKRWWVDGTVWENNEKRDGFSRNLYPSWIIINKQVIAFVQARFPIYPKAKCNDFIKDFIHKTFEWVKQFYTDTEEGLHCLSQQLVNEEGEGKTFKLSKRNDIWSASGSTPVHPGSWCRMKSCIMLKAVVLQLWLYERSVVI